MSKSVRLPQIDMIKFISALAVFFIHYAGIYMQTFNGLYSAYLTPIRNLCFFSVPVFFIASGFLHADKEYSYKKILPKILYFYFITFSIDFIFEILNTYIRNQNYSVNLSTMLINSLLLHLMSHSHLWFMISIMILYLFVPIFSSAKPGDIFVLTILTTIFSFFKPLLFPSINFPFPLPYYFSYFLIGYSIKHLSYIQKQLIMILCFILFVLCMIINTSANKFDYNGPLIFFLAISIFLFLLSINIRNQHLINIFNMLSVASLGIYISHPVFIHFLFTYKKIRLSLPIFWAFLPILFTLNVFLVLLVKKLISFLQAKIFKNN